MKRYVFLLILFFIFYHSKGQTLAQKVVDYMITHKKEFIIKKNLFICANIKDIADKYDLLNFSDDSLVKKNFNIESTRLEKDSTSIGAKLIIPREFAETKKKVFWEISPQIRIGNIFCVFAEVQMHTGKSGKKNLFVFDANMKLIKYLSTSYIE